MPALRAFPALTAIIARVWVAGKASDEAPKKLAAELYKKFAQSPQ